MTMAFRVEVRGEDRTCTTVAEVSGNYQRLVQIAVARKTLPLRFVPFETYGDPLSHRYAFDLR